MMGRLQRLILPLIGLSAAGLIVAIGVAGAPGASRAELMTYLIGASLLSVGLAVAAGLWLRRGRGPLWLQMALTYAVGVAISLINILLTVQTMLLSNSELPLLVLLLIFAGVVSLGLGVSLALALGRRVSALNEGARALAGGDLRARVAVRGSDEIAQLAAEFNQMADQLAAMAEERARQEAARRDLVVAVSHDLRTPLASLRAIAEALSDGLVSDEATQRRYLATMRGQVGLLNEMIDDLFELAQLDAGAARRDRQAVSLGDLVSDVLNGLGPQAAARGVALGGDPAPQGDLALVAPQQIERVLYNLVANAIRHTPAGGAVRICVEPGPPGQLLVGVADTGEGIAPEDLPRIFDRFYRGEKSRSRSTGGAGLGLAIARGIVEAHGGRIWAESTLGQGTTVRFTLPDAGTGRALPSTTD